jgi:uncharacterized protein (TIGR02453 family)
MKQNQFAGFPAEGITFLRALAKNNDREWFAPRKAIFEEKVKRPMIDLVAAVHREMLRFAPEYVGEPAKCVYRIYRDTRFSKDKTPYKTHIAAYLRRNGLPKDGTAGYYFAISPKELSIGGGLYMPPRDALLAARHHIAVHHEEFRSTFDTRKVRKLLGDLYGEAMTRVPKGFDADHPAADLLKRKHWFLYAELDPKLAVSPGLVKEIVSRFEAMGPLIEFLNRPLLAQEKKKAREERFFV